MPMDKRSTHSSPLGLAMISITSSSTSHCPTQTQFACEFLGQVHRRCCRGESGAVFIPILRTRLQDN